MGVFSFGRKKTALPFYPHEGPPRWLIKTYIIKHILENLKTNKNKSSKQLKLELTYIHKNHKSRLW